MLIKKAVILLVAVFLFSYQLNFAEDEHELRGAVQDVFMACDILKDKYVGEISYAKLYSGALNGAERFLCDNGINYSVNGIAEGNSLTSARLQFYNKLGQLLRVAKENKISIDGLVFSASAGSARAVSSGHTGFVFPKMMQAIDVTDKYLNVGAKLAKVDDCIFFHVVLPNGPSARAGLKKFDVILEIDGRSVPDNLREVSRLVLGRLNGNVSIKVSRLGKVIEKPFIVRRDAGNLNYCITKLLQYRGKKFGYVFLRTFMAELNVDSYGVRELVGFLDGAKFSGLILDLRGNSGGYIYVLQQALALFFNKRMLIMNVQNKVKLPLESFETNQAIPSAGCAVDMPLVVLVDERSGSASEVFAGIIKELNRGKVVGVTTCGSVEISRFFGLRQRDQNVGLWIATGRIALPSGKALEGRGVRPDFYAPLTKANVLAGEDAQLESALYVLEKEIRSKK